MNLQIMRQIVKNLNRKSTRQLLFNTVNRQNQSQCCCYSINRHDWLVAEPKEQIGSNNHLKLLLLPAGILSIFKKSDEDEETPEDKMIMTIKRSILCIQRGQHDKAEQMLHLALRMAQALQNKDGITFVYDVMANLAMEMEQFGKAEKLFVNVMQRLMQDGYAEDDIKLLHISSKIAHIAALQNHFEKAQQGFVWTLQKLTSKMQQLKDDPDLYELFGLTKDCYAQLLMKMNRFDEAKQYFIDAFDIYLQVHGKDNPEVVLLLNNLAVVCTNINDLVAAEVYLAEALTLAKKFPEMYESGVVQANQGLLLLKQGLLEQAKKSCALAWRLAKKADSVDGIEQADYCLKQIGGLMK